MGLGLGKVAAPDSHASVTMLELFFDLVFVYLITALTSLIVHGDGWRGYAQAALVLAVTFWMYDGYAWLANNVPPTTTSTRLPMLLAMACFLAMAVVVPDVFGSGAWVFAVSYLLLVTIHAIQFGRSTLGSSAQGIRATVPINYGCAALLVLAAIVGSDLRWICWALAVALLLATMVRRRGSSRLTVQAGHFVERHQLLVIIALGETVVAIGAGAQGELTRGWVLLAFVLAMVLICALWWVYYAVGDDELGREVVMATPEQGRGSLALVAYSYIGLLHISGLVLVAVGLHFVVQDPVARLPWGTALTLSVGVASYLVGQAAFRARLRIGPTSPHLIASLAVLAVVPLGALVTGWLQLLGCVLVALALATVLQRAGAPGAHAAAVDSLK
ncbi:MAG TPA: low temperature requirement protein A [Candidatus Nanopelagicales bacterium]